VGPELRVRVLLVDLVVRTFQAGNRAAVVVVAVPRWLGIAVLEVPQTLVEAERVETFLLNSELVWEKMDSLLAVAVATLD
jgi:hypothetical protein